MLKVLFINNFAYPDYLSNMVYIGLAQRQDVELYTYAAPFHLIKGIGWNDKFCINRKWENSNKPPGFTVCNLLSTGPIIELPEEINYKIQNKFYDKIIFSSIWRDRTFLDKVLKVYEKNKLVFLDGEDHENVYEPVVEKGYYFKRELNSIRGDVKPISFAIPDSLLNKNYFNKTQLFGCVFPGKPDTYIFKNEQDYYLDYKRSYYGVTFKKGGWDCLRHYEILANNCIPYFINLENCPRNILHNWPKKLLLYTNEYAKSSLVPVEYFSILEELNCFVEKNLTTSALVKYVTEISQ